MATITDLNAKRVEMNNAVQAYKQALADYAVGSITLTQLNDAKVTAQVKGDEYAKLAGTVKRDNPATAEDDFYSNPGLMTAEKRTNVKTIMSTGLLRSPYLEIVFNTEGNSAGVADISIPIRPGSDYTIDWGDGTVETGQVTALSHTYGAPGIYTVKISGRLAGFTTSPVSRDRQLVDVANWGDVTFDALDNMFYRRQGFTISATDAPTLLPGAILDYLFYHAEEFNDDISHWDVSNVVSLKNTFEHAHVFNQPLNSWDVSGVTNLSRLMAYAYAFNQSLNSWNVSSVTSLVTTFEGALAFNQPLNNWDTSNVTGFYATFWAASSYNQDLSMWNVSSRTSGTKSDFNRNGIMPANFLPALPA